MTDAELFHRETLRYGLGGRLIFQPESPSAKSYDQIRKRAETLVVSARENLPRLPHIHLDFVSNENINAFAFKSEGRYFIGLTYGTIYLLELIFMRMLSDSRLFDTIGNPNDESDNLPTLAGFLPEAKKMHEAGNIAKLPKTQKRQHYAVYLFDQAVLFLLGHEIAHITLGHVDYRESKAKAAMLAEMEWNAPDSEGMLERQCFEMQANMRSVFSRIESIKLTYNAHKSDNLKFPSWLDSNPSESHLIFDWAFAMNSFFRLFGDVRFNTSQLTANSYPPLPLRRTMATTTAYAAVMERWNPALKEKGLHSLQTAMKIFGARICYDSR